jgi:hypothetical protein
MKKSILALILVLSLSLTGTFVVSAGNEVTDANLAVETLEDYENQIMSHPSSCGTCGSSLNFSAVTVGTFTDRTHSYGLFWIHTCHYQTAPISRIASCISITCNWRTTLNGTRHRNHGRTCTHNNTCTATCNESNGDRW